MRNCTNKQYGYMMHIAKELHITLPLYATMSRSTASSWISTHLKQLNVIYKDSTKPSITFDELMSNTLLFEAS